MQPKQLGRIVMWAGLLGLLLALPVLAAPDESHRAGVVIDYGDGRVNTYCVTFTESSLTGYELLQRTGLKIDAAADATGIAVCRIGDADGVGCSPSNCFCQFPKYWSYWNQSDGAWVYSNVGAGSAQITDGMVNGWLWGDATQPPQMVSFDVICADADPTPTHTPTPTATLTTLPTSSPTATAPAPQLQAAQPTATPEPYAKFWADADTLEAGTCALLHWETVEMIEVWLDGEFVDSKGTVTVCPCEPEAHELEVTYPDGSTETLGVKIDVEGECAGGAVMIELTATPTPPASGALLPTATPTRAPGADRGTPSAGDSPEPPSDGEPKDAAGDAPPEDAPSAFLSILPTPTAPPLPSPTMPAAESLAGDATQSTAEIPETPEPKATLPEGAAAALLATPTRHLMDAPEAETSVSAYIPERVEGAPETSEEIGAAQVLLHWAGYFTFGLLLVALGGAHLFIQRQHG